MFLPATGITTVLTMTFLGLEARTDLPKVPYSTALDLFVWISYGFIFATIIEVREGGRLVEKGKIAKVREKLDKGRDIKRVKRRGDE